MARISLFRWALLAGALCIVFFTNLGAARLWDRDEPRNSRASHEMLERGDWIVPTFNGELRDHKPILLYWGQMASYLAIGESEFAARLPSVLCALLTVVATCILASRLSGKSKGLNAAGYWSAAALGTSLLFVMAGRAATPDACLVAFSTLGIAALVIASLRPSNPHSSGRVGSARWLPAAVAYIMLGLAVLAKGPVGLILPLAVVHGWWLVCFRLQSQEPETARHATERRTLGQRAIVAIGELWLTFNPWQCLRAIWALRAIPGVLLALLAAAPWYFAVGMETQGEFLRGFFWEHNVGRAVSSMEGHSGSVFFYPAALLAGTFPWSLWFIPMLMWARQAAKACVLQRQMLVLACMWVGVYLTAFTIASTKLPSYITPCYAGAALLIGGYWRQFESEWALPSLTWRRIAYGVTISIGLGITGVIYWLSLQERMPLLTRAALAGLAIVCVGCVALFWELRQQWSRIPMTWLAGAVAFQGILFGYGTRSVDYYRTDLATILSVDAQQPSEHWLTIGGLEPSWVHYLGREITEVREHPQSPDSWLSVQQFLETNPDGYIIVVGEEAKRHVQQVASAIDAPDTKPPAAGSLPPLELVSEGARFLRPGNVSVYRLRETRTAAQAESAEVTR